MHHTLSSFVAAIVAASLAAQNGSTLPSKLPPDVDALAQRVHAAHRPDGEQPPVTEFRGSLEVELIAPDAPQAGRAELAIEFLSWRRPGSERVRSLVHYEVQEAGQPIERGRDENGAWHRFQGEVRDLGGSEFEADRRALERDTNLARQLLRFLSPGDVLRSLTDPSPVRDEELRLGREAPKPCTAVEGGLAAFPLLQKGGEDAPVHVKVWVTRDDAKLYAIEVWPLVDGEKRAEGGELIRLLDLREQDGLLVPRKLEHFYRLADGSLRVQWRTTITKLSLRPGLESADLARPAK